MFDAVGRTGFTPSKLLFNRWCLLCSFLHGQKVGFFNQQYADQLNMEETASEYLMRKFNLPYQDSRKCLGRFGLESHAHTIQISKLSGTNLNACRVSLRFKGGVSDLIWVSLLTGGQKARVVFSELACHQPDVLILVRAASRLTISVFDLYSEQRPD